jgi:hypothetical protein
MPANNATRRSRLLARATMAPLAAVAHTSQPAEPLLKTPRAAQRSFEGDFFDAVRDLHYRPRSALKLLTGHTVIIQRVIPGSQSLELRLSPKMDLEGWLAPAIPVLDEEGVLSGVPGLRIQVLAPDRVRLIRMGKQAEIRLVGAPTGELGAGLVAPPTIRSVLLHSSGALHVEEVRRIDEDTRRNLEARHDSMSALIRRMGLLSRFQPWGIDSWGWMGAGTATEVFVKALNAELVETFIEDMTSSWLEPRLRLHIFSGEDRRAVQLHFGTADIASFLQVRIRHEHQTNDEPFGP